MGAPAYLLSAGSLRHRVTLQQLTGSQDAIGQPVPTWVDVATVWADVRYLNGIETLKAGAEVAIARASIRIRWRAGVTAAMRVLHGSVVFAIQAVLPDASGNEYLDLACETGASQG